MTEIVLIIISAVIGAGFATGAELLSFFGSTGLSPFVTAVLVGVFSMILMTIMVYAKRKDSKITNVFFMTTYVLIFAVMSTGVRHLAGLSTMLVALVLCVLTVMWGFKSVTIVNKYLMFFVLGILLFTCLHALVLDPNQSTQTTSPTRGIWHGIWRALIYSGLNCLMLEKTYEAIKKQHSRRFIIISSAIATAIICVMVFLILTTLNYTGVKSDMPIVTLSDTVITRMAVLFCILTSMMICLYNIVSKNQSQTKQSTVLLKSALVCLIAFCASFFGFKDILGFIYPLIGIGMVLYCVWLGWGLYRGWVACRQSSRRQLLGIDNAENSLDIISNK